MMTEGSVVYKKTMTSALRAAAVLVHKSAGVVLCPKCNILNLVRDNKFQCCCKFTADIIDCACGKCGLQLLDIGSKGRPQSFIVGHAGGLKKGADRYNWKGGRKKSSGYIKIKYEPFHPRKDDRGYILEHILVYEDYNHCCILPWIHVHHRDGNRENNNPDNLQLVTKSEHKKIHHLEKRHKILERGIICPHCDSKYVVKHGLIDGLQRFDCCSCHKTWRTTKDDHTKPYTITGARRESWGQKCMSCGSLHINSDGVVNHRQRFRCISCKKSWYGAWVLGQVPINIGIVKAD